MRKHLRLAAIVVLVSIWAMSACAKPAPGADQQSPRSTLAANLDPADARATATVSADKATEKQWAYTDASSPDNLDTYRLKSVTTLQEEGSQPATVELLIEYDHRDSAQHMVITNQNPQAGTGKSDVMEVIRIADDSYAKVGENDWITLQIPFEELLPSVGVMYKPESLLGAAEARFDKTETVNGLETEHYTYDQNAMAQTGLFESVVNTSGEVWVSTKYNVAVRSIIHVEGQDATTGKMVTVDVQNELTDINSDIVIRAPEGVEKAQIPDDIPLMPGASNVVSMMGMTRFDVDATVDEVTQFFKTQMLEKGWKEATSVAPGFLTYQKGNRIASIAVQTQGTQTGVAIIVQDQQ